MRKYVRRPALITEPERAALPVAEESGRAAAAAAIGVEGQRVQTGAGIATLGTAAVTHRVRNHKLARCCLSSTVSAS
jgi:hypothetical protein